MCNDIETARLEIQNHPAIISFKQSVRELIEFLKEMDRQNFSEISIESFLLYKNEKILFENIWNQYVNLLNKHKCEIIDFNWMLTSHRPGKPDNEYCKINKEKLLKLQVTKILLDKILSEKK